MGLAEGGVGRPGIRESADKNPKPIGKLSHEPLYSLRDLVDVSPPFPLLGQE